MRTAPPNRYTNTTISITGSSSAVSSASGLRTDSRRLRAVMLRASEMSGLLGGGGGQGEENVVQGGAVHGEAGDQAAVRVGRVQQGADLRGAAVGGHAYGQTLLVQAHHVIGQAAPDLVERGR